MKRGLFSGASKRGLLAVLGGNVSAQFVALLTLPLISRLFTPEEFGFLSFVLAIVGVLAPAATLRFESAAVLTEDPNETKAVVWNAILATASVSLGTALVLQFLVAGDVNGLSTYPSIIYWVPMLVALTAFFSLFTQLTLRKQLFMAVAQRTFWRSIATSASQIGIGIFARGWDGLLIGTAIGHSVGVASMVYRVREYLSLPPRGEIRRMQRKYWRFPAIFAPSTLLNVLGAQLPLIFFSIHFGISMGGQLGMAERIVGLPVTVIGFAISQVIQADGSKALRTQKVGLFNMYLRYSAVLAVLGVVAAIGFGALGGWLIPFVLGEQWTVAGQIVQVLAVPSAVRLVASSLSNILVLLQNAKANFFLDVMRVILVSAAAIFVISFDLNWLTSLWVFYSGMALTYLVTWFVGLNAVRKRDLHLATASNMGD